MAVPTPHEVVILRPGTDAYGNPASSFENPTEIPARGFHVSKLPGTGTEDILLLPPNVDIRMGDRVRVNGALYYVDAQAPARSPSATVLISVSLTRVEA